MKTERGVSTVITIKASAYALRLRASVWAVGLAFALPAQADLVQAWRQAQAVDPGVAAKAMEQRAGQARREQASALWAPTVYLSASTGLMGSQSATRGAQFSSDELDGKKYEESAFNTSILMGVSARAAITAIKPLIDREREAGSRQLQLSAEATDLAKEVSQQELMLAVAQRYLDVLASQEALRLSEKQALALARADNELKRRRKLRDATVMDVQESAERLQSLRARQVAIKTDIAERLSALKDLAGDVNLKPLRTTVDVGTRPLADVSIYLEQMAKNHPALRMLDLHVQAAMQEAQKYVQGHQAARVDAIAQASVDHLSGRGQFGAASNTGSQQMIGIQLTVPLSTGGLRSAKQEEALALAEKLRLERDKLRLDMQRHVRLAWHALAAAPERLAAQEEALKTSLARVEGTRKAQSVGSRTTLELLSAEADAVAAEQAVFMERLSFLANQLRLAAATGNLSEETLAQANAFLMP